MRGVLLLLLGRCSSVHAPMAFSRLVCEAGFLLLQLLEKKRVFIRGQFVKGLERNWQGSGLPCSSGQLLPQAKEVGEAGRVSQLSKAEQRECPLWVCEGTCLTKQAVGDGNWQKLPFFHLSLHWFRRAAQWLLEFPQADWWPTCREHGGFSSLWQASCLLPTKAATIFLSSFCPSPPFSCPCHQLPGNQVLVAVELPVHFMQHQDTRCCGCDFVKMSREQDGGFCRQENFSLLFIQWLLQLYFTQRRCRIFQL